MTDDNGPIKGGEKYTSNNVKKIFDVYEPLRCKKCNKSFQKKTSLKSHLRAHEFDDHSYNSKKEKIDRDKNRAHTCNVCDKGFTAKKNLLKHLRVIHKNIKEAEKLQVKKTRCPEKNCAYTCRKIGDLRSHIEKLHKIKILKDTLHFLNEEDFLKWKKEEEMNSVASFVSFRRKGMLKSGVAKKVLLCHRTGQYNPKGKGKHRLKSHGSCKIGGTCPAAMEIIQSLDGQITVSYYKTHLGHDKDIVHLQLSKEDKEKITEKIEQGFSLDAILEDVKESIDPETCKTKRLHLLSKKDLYNIMQSCNKKIKSNPDTDMDEIFIKSNEEEKEDYQNKFENVSQVVFGEEQALQIIQIKNAADNNVIPASDVENKSFNKQFANLPNKSADTVVDNTYKPVGLQSNVVSKTIGRRSSKYEDKKISRPRKTIAKSAKSQVLLSKLEEKMKKVCDLLPKSQFLTPKQYEIVSRSLDGIINVYNSVNIKTNLKILELENAVNETENSELGLIRIFTGPFIFIYCYIS